MTRITTTEMDTLLSQMSDAGLLPYRYQRATTWADALGDLDADKVEEACWHIIRNQKSGAPYPTPGDIRAAIDTEAA